MEIFPLRTFYLYLTGEEFRDKNLGEYLIERME